MLPKVFSEARKKYWHSNLLDGYLQLLSDEEILKYSAITNASISDLNDIEVFATTAFGDLLVWDGAYIYMLRLAESKIDVILSGFEFFFANVFDAEYQKDMFDLLRFHAVKNKIGEISRDECYIYEPIPLLGGDMDVNTITIGKRMEYIQFLLSLQK